MSCTNCKQIYPIPSCVTELTIGKITDFNASVFVLFDDVTSGRKTYLPATSTGDGTVKIDTSSENFPDNHSHVITITNSIGAQTGMAFTIDDESFPCVNAQFERLRDESGEIATVVTYALKVKP